MASIANHLLDLLPIALLGPIADWTHWYFRGLRGAHGSWAGPAWFKMLLGVILMCEALPPTLEK